ncbi:hypothetical protein QQP08_024287 [Theobroma cacao]|nr:hypothetical protein QQP08_024287 [Theobroma cacao]
MVLRGPAVNRSLNRENPDILIVMIAEKQKMRCGEKDKADQRERERSGYKFLSPLQVPGGSSEQDRMIMGTT